MTLSKRSDPLPRFHRATPIPASSHHRLKYCKHVQTSEERLQEGRQGAEGAEGAQAEAQGTAEETDKAEGRLGDASPVRILSIPRTCCLMRTNALRLNRPQYVCLLDEDFG